jgi:hypothetical protein
MKRSGNDAAKGAQTMQSLESPAAADITTPFPARISNEAIWAKSGGPLPGFGKSWRKRYAISLDIAAVTPSQVMEILKRHLVHFAPRGNHAFAPFTRVDERDIATLLSPDSDGARLSTGVTVLASGPVSLALLAPAGHSFSGWIGFVAAQSAASVTIQVELFMRAADPLSELSLEINGHRRDDEFWSKTLGLLSAYFGTDAPVAIEIERLDDHYTWTQASNVLHNPTLRSGVGQVATPVRWGLALVRWPFARERAA